MKYFWAKKIHEIFLGFWVLLSTKLNCVKVRKYPFDYLKLKKMDGKEDLIQKRKRKTFTFLNIKI